MAEVAASEGLSETEVRLHLGLEDAAKIVMSGGLVGPPGMAVRGAD